MKFSTWGLTYEDACKLIDALKSENFDAHIAAGGISMYPEEARIERFYQICSEHNTVPMIGNTLHQEQILNPGKANKWINDAVRTLHGIEMGLKEDGHG
jgi:hypothetical protein